VYKKVIFGKNKTHLKNMKNCDLRLIFLVFGE